MTDIATVAFSSGGGTQSFSSSHFSHTTEYKTSKRRTDKWNAETSELDCIPRHAQKAIRCTIDNYMSNVLMVLVTTCLSSLDPGLICRSTVITIPLSNRMRYNILDFGTVRGKVESNRQRIITINKSKRAILRMSATLPIPEIVHSIIFDYLNVVMDRTSETQEKHFFDISALINLAAKIVIL
jgi:hypothetical protein